MRKFSKRATLLTIASLLCSAFLLFALLLGQNALSQILPSSAPATSNSKSADRLGRDTPYGTVFGFLHAAQEGNNSLAAQYLQMSASRRQSEGDTLAMKLNVVMNRSLAGNLQPSRQPEGTPQEDVPLDRQNLGTMSSGDVEDQLELVRVNDPTAGKIWLISSDTLSKIPELYDQVEARQVETKLPRWMVKYQLGGMPLWQLLALIVMLPVAAGIGWLVLVILQIPLRWWARRRGQADLEHSRSLSAPLWLLLTTLAHRAMAAYLAMPLLPRHDYSQVILVALIISGAWILWRVIRWFLNRVRSRAIALGHGGTGSLMLLGERMIKAGIFIIALFFVLGTLGVNLTAALAGLGIGGLAIGFGAQQTIANLFGGLSVLGDEVIRVGDLCKFGDRTGTVEDIGLRSTRVRTEERTLLAIPNGTVATINVENLSRREKMLFKTLLSFHPDTASEHLQTVLADLRGLLTSKDKVETSTARVRLTEITATSINVEVVCYVLTQDFDVFANTRESLLLQIMKYVEESPANLARPSQTLYLSSDGSAGKEKIQSAGEKPVEQNTATDSRRG
jgi:MscS family membrane protein